MKGIILAGGSGTRLRPLTDIVCKQLLPVYDKPMIYYPLSTLMMLGIRDILIISTPRDTPVLENFLGNGDRLGIRLSYTVQEKPEGLAQAFLLGESFIAGEPVCLILGDNLLYWGNLGGLWKDCVELQHGAFILGYHVRDPERFGVIEMDPSGLVLSLEEKPAQPRSNYAAIGLYFYDSRVVDYAKSLRPSARGELEITDLNNLYLRDGSLKAKVLSRGSAWLDAGTFESLMRASSFIEAVEERQGLKIGCPEEVAYNMGYIDSEKLKQLSGDYAKSAYGAYLQMIAENR
ncbi:MAG: glucose-1-phosphate thymidylyltransferase RfbA [Pseudomonadota bacterium]|nr:glucose-1-phosphate thymidylyltransferase RfbA [Pseudomonadota bacterium]